MTPETETPESLELSPSLDVTLYRPHAGQRLVHASRARFRIATCGRRFGKTTMAVNEMARIALSAPRRVTAWIAPSYQQTKIAFRWLTDQFFPAFSEKEPPSLSEMRVVWRNQSTSQFFSAENYDALRGFGFHFVVGDEFGTWPREAWEQVIRPALSDTAGRALLVGTPNGRNLFWDLWMKGQDPAANPEFESWQLSSSARLSARELASAREQLPADVFRQEYEAAFLEDGAGVFRHVDRCERGDFEEPAHPHQYVIGWDPAKHADASVIAVMHAESRHVVAWERILQTDYTIQLGRVAALSQRFRNALVMMDSTGVGDPLLEQLRALNVPCEGFTFTNQTKQQLVEHLAVLVERTEVTWPKSLVVLRRELEAFRYDITRAGNVRYAAPAGQHDDCVMALGLAAWAARHYGAGAPLAAGLRAEPWEASRWGATP